MAEISVRSRSFFEGDGAFISGDLVKPELYLRKNYMIAPAVSSPDRIGKNALIDRDYSDVFTACSSSGSTPNFV